MSRRGGLFDDDDDEGMDTGDAADETDGEQKIELRQDSITLDQVRRHQLNVM